MVRRQPPPRADGLTMVLGFRLDAIGGPRKGVRTRRLLIEHPRPPVTHFLRVRVIGFIRHIPPTRNRRAPRLRTHRTRSAGFQLPNRRLDLLQPFVRHRLVAFHRIQGVLDHILVAFEVFMIPAKVLMAHMVLSPLPTRFRFASERRHHANQKHHTD